MTVDRAARLHAVMGEVLGTDIRVGTVDRVGQLQTRVGWVPHLSVTVRWREKGVL